MYLRAKTTTTIDDNKTRINKSYFSKEPSRSRRAFSLQLQAGYRTYHLDSMSSIPGGNSAAKVPSGPDDEIYAIFTDAIKQELSLVEVNVHSCGSTHSLLCHTPLSTNNGVEIHRTDTTQVVAGTRYQIKIRVEDGSFWHFSVIKPLPHTGDPPFIQPG